MRSKKRILNELKNFNFDPKYRYVVSYYIGSGKCKEMVFHSAELGSRTCIFTQFKRDKRCKNKFKTTKTIIDKSSVDTKYILRLHKELRA